MQVWHKEIEFYGQSLVIEVSKYKAGRPAPIASTPDSPGYDDEGEAEEIDYHVVSKKVIDTAKYQLFSEECLEDAIWFEEELRELISEKIQEEGL